MNDLRVYVSISRKYPEHLVFEAASARNNSQEDTSNVVSVVEEARTATARLSYGIDMLQLNPNDSAGNLKLSGVALFNNMELFRNHNTALEKK